MAYPIYAVVAILVLKQLNTIVDEPYMVLDSVALRWHLR